MNTKNEWDILIPHVESMDADALMDEVVEIMHGQFFAREDWADFEEHFNGRKSHKFRIKMSIEKVS